MKKKECNDYLKKNKKLKDEIKRKKMLTKSMQM